MRIWRRTVSPGMSWERGSCLLIGGAFFLPFGVQGLCASVVSHELLSYRSSSLG